MIEEHTKELDTYIRQLMVSKLQEDCLKVEQLEHQTEHLFSDGLYTRTMIVPAGAFVIGKVHRLRTLNIMTKGRAVLYKGDGEKIGDVVAPITFVSNPMERKIAFFVEDSEWVNVHPTDETDLDKIEEKFIVPEREYLKYLEEEATKCLGET